MDWQSYKLYRFRKSRSRLYPSNLRDVTFYSSLDGIEGNLLQRIEGTSYWVWMVNEDTITQTEIEQMRQSLETAPHMDGVFLPGIEGNGYPRALLLRSYTARFLDSLFSLPQDLLMSLLQLGLTFNIYELSTVAQNAQFHSNLFTKIDSEAGPITNINADFLRDFYLSPCIFLIEPLSPSSTSSNLVADIKKRLLSSGNVVIDFNEYCDLVGNDLWSPVVYLGVTGDPIGVHPNPKAPDHAFKAILTDNTSPDLSKIESGWELGLVVSRKITSSYKSHDYKRYTAVSSDPGAIISLLDIHAHAHSAARIFGYKALPQHPRRGLSVIICTYHRPSCLSEALHALAYQDFPPDKFEVIVVNNDPWDEAPTKVVKEVSSLGVFPESSLRLISCFIPGLSNARNTGMLAAEGEILCFLDDDAVPTVNWLDEAWKAFNAHPEAGVIGGMIHLVPPDPRPKALMENMERFWSHFVPPYQKYTEVTNYKDFPWGANWCVRRQALLQIGGFRSQYGRQKRDFSGGEELISALLLQKLGWKIGVSPSMVVDHKPDPERYTFNDLNRTIQSQIIINYRMRRDLYLPEEISVARQARGLGRFSGRLLKLLALPSETRKSLAVEYYGYIQAWIRLFFEQLRDAAKMQWGKL